jgi:hypothetical protein
MMETMIHHINSVPRRDMTPQDSRRNDP